jgi:hypothetical protein
MLTVAKAIHGNCLACVQSQHHHWSHTVMTVTCCHSPKMMRGERAHIHVFRRRSGRPQGQVQAEGLACPRCGGVWWQLIQPWCAPSPASHPSLTDPALRANSYPKVTVSKNHWCNLPETAERNRICHGLQTSHLKLLTLLASAYKEFPPNTDTSCLFVALLLPWDSLWVSFTNFIGISPGDSSLFKELAFHLAACFW